MSIAHEFEYVKAGSLDEALACLAEPVEGGSMVLAGGSDLIAWLRDGAVKPGRLVDVKGLKELQGIRREGQSLWIGAAVPFADMLDSALVKREAPVLWEAAGMVASVGVRNRATAVGNICSAVPCCDAGPALLVYGATVCVATPEGMRRISAGAWFLGPRRTALPAGTVVTGLKIPMGRHAGAFAKLKRYRGEDLAQASVAVRVDAKGTWRVAYGSVAPTPIRGPKAERVLKGTKALDEGILERVAEAAMGEVAPITDIRSSAEYRRRMIGVMTKRACAAALARLKGKGPAYGLNVAEEGWE